MEMGENCDFSAGRGGRGRKFCERTGEREWRSLAWLSPIDTRVRGGRGTYLGDGGLGCGDVQRPEKSPRNVATRESGGRRWKKEGWIIGIVGGGCARGEVGCALRERERRGGGGGRLDAKRVDSALLDQGPLSLVGGGREDADTGGGGEGGARDEEGRLRRTRVRANRERE